MYFLYQQIPMTPPRTQQGGSGGGEVARKKIPSWLPTQRASLIHKAVWKTQTKGTAGKESDMGKRVQKKRSKEWWKLEGKVQNNTGTGTKRTNTTQNTTRKQNKTNQNKNGHKTAQNWMYDRKNENMEGDERYRKGKQKITQRRNHNHGNVIILSHFVPPISCSLLSLPPL